MDWTSILLAVIGTGGIVEIANLGYFKPKLREAKADASIKEIEADKNRSGYLEERVSSMEKLFAEQGKRLDLVNTEVLDLKTENTSIKQEMVVLRAENASLKKQLSEVKQENANLKKQLDKYEHK